MGLLPGERRGIYLWRSSRSERYSATTLTAHWRAAADKIGSVSTLHDARRTVATQVAMLTQSTEPGERLLNHALGGIQGRYIHDDFGEMKAKALQLWSDKLQSLVEDYFSRYTATQLSSSPRSEGTRVN
jgi:hypothetical protein